MNLSFKTIRFLIYRSRKSRTYLCVVAARDAAHALEIANRTFFLSNDAFAVEEGRMNGGAA